MIGDGTLSQDLVNDVISDAWKDTVAAAEQYNKPGEFTTFVAYEYTAFSSDRGNLHRNVIFRDADKLPAVPFSSLHSRNPEDLWDWMDGLRDEGIESLAIPHNSNGSNGQMFKLVDWAGNPLDDDYSSQRIRNEPLIEITQIKGTSETHPLLSDNDEWAGFEIMPFRVGSVLPSEPSGSYAREALLNGLSFEDQGMANPFDFGFVGASDTHTAAIGDDESDFYGKLGLTDATPQQTGAVPLSAEAGRVVSKTGQIPLRNLMPAFMSMEHIKTLAQLELLASGRKTIHESRSTTHSVARKPLPPLAHASKFVFLVDMTSLMKRW